jgi:hypothetical protein
MDLEKTGSMFRVYAWLPSSGARLLAPRKATSQCRQPDSRAWRGPGVRRVGAKQRITDESGPQQIFALMSLRH